MRARFHARLVNACIRAHAQATPLRPEQLQGRDHRRRRHRRRAGGRAAPHDARSRRVTGSTASTPTRTSRCALIEAADRVLPGAAAAPVAGDGSAAAQARRRGAYEAPRSPRCCATGVRLDDGRVIAGRAGVVGGRRQGARLPEGYRGAGDQPHQPAGRAADPADHARRTTSSPSATAPPAPGPMPTRARAARPAARTGGAPAGHTHLRPDQAPASRASRCGTTATATSVRSSRWVSSAPSAT